MNSLLKSEVRTTFHLALPIIGSQLLFLSMTFTHNLVIGSLGKEQFAGLAIGSGTYGLALVLMTGLLGNLGSLIAQSNDNNRAPGGVMIYVHSALSLALFCSFLIIFAFNFLGDIALYFGQDPKAVRYAIEYIDAMRWALPAQVAWLVMRHLVEGLGRGFPATIIGGAAALLNIPLTYVMAHGYSGIPAFGVSGAGWTAAVLSWSMLLAIIGYAARAEFAVHIQFLIPNFLFHTQAIQKIVKVGIPVSLAMAAEMGIFVVSVFVVGTLGVTALAAHQIVLNITSFIIMIPIGLSFAVSIRIGHYIGQNDRDGIRRAWLASLLITLAMQVCTAASLILFPSFFASFYSPHPEVQALAIKLIVIAGVFQIADGMQVVGMGALRGLGLGNYALAVAVPAFWIVGMGVVMALRSTPEGIWYGLASGLGVAALLQHIKLHLATRQFK